MMTQDVIDKLMREDDQDPFHEALLDRAKRLMRMSRSHMSKNYDAWDMQERIYRGEVVQDTEDKKQELKGEPEKMVVPNSFAQIQTFVSFLFLMFNQNRTFFELIPGGDEDYGKKHMDSEKLLDRDLRRNEWNSKLYQHLLDVGRFGLGVLETCWTKQTTHAWVTPPPSELSASGVGVQIEQQPAWQEFLKFEGNLVRNISPYRFFPDTRFPLVDFQKGEFCAAEEEYSMVQLRQLQRDGEVAGVEHIGVMPKNYVEDLGAPLRSGNLHDENIIFKFDAEQGSSVALVTKMQIWLVPSEFKLDGDKPLGPEKHKVLYHLWFANNNRVIRIEPAYWWHNEFGWTIAQYTPDMHQTLTFGLADLIYKLQDLISWYYNSHVKSVRRVIQNRLIVNAQAVETRSLDGEGDIYMRKGMNIPVNNAVGQLRVQDVTGNHMQDADMLTKVIEMVTGVNGNAMGQYNSGRRSAQEARVVTAGAAGRMKMHGHLIWESSLGRLGRLMLCNLRQMLSMESFARVVGTPPGNMMMGITPEMELMQRFQAFKGTPEEVICGEDYMMFDSTLASEKGFMAQSLQELLVAVMSNPMAAQQLDVSAKAMLEEIQYLRGAGNVRRFSMSGRVAQGLEAPPMPVALPQPGAQPAVQ